ncbi:MAG TPA: arginyltransferase, partial [Accumulibacter sp.]|nr:arginyltransferase [Accumulibacter sp.]
AVLWQIEYCRQRGLPYLYLGYWIQNCRKMRYKLRYRPAELLIDQRWIQLN